MVKLKNINLHIIRKLPRPVLVQVHSDSHFQYDESIRQDRVEPYFKFIVTIHDIAANEMIRRGIGHHTILKKRKKPSKIRKFLTKLLKRRKS